MSTTRRRLPELGDPNGDNKTARPEPRRHRLNLEKAANQISDNLTANCDTGETSQVYKLNSSFDKISLVKIADEYVFTHHQLSESSKSEAFALKSLDEWRKLMTRKESPDNDESQLLIDTNYSLNKKKKTSSVGWQEIGSRGSLEDARNQAMRFIIERRKSLGWYSMLPASGTLTRATMEKHIDDLEAANQRLKFDDGQYIYAVCATDINRKMLYSPYDLIAVDANKLADLGFSTYYLITASNVTKINEYEENEQTKSDVEITNVLKWLWEKDQFEILRKIRLFRLFRKKKTFRDWRRNVRESKQIRSREFLKRRLFSANEILQNVLVHIRNLCEEASSSANGRGSNDQTEILMIRFDPSVTYTLDEFRSVQYEQIDLALHRLQTLKEEIMNICYLACITVGELEGIDFDAFFDSDNFKHEESFIDSYLRHRQNKTSRLRDLHLIFPAKKEKGPSFVKRKEWRYVLARLTQFLRLVDYLIQELLHRVVKTSLRHLHDYVFKAGSNVEPDSNHGFKRLELNVIRKFGEVESDDHQRHIEVIDEYPKADKKEKNKIEDVTEFNNIKDIEKLLKNIEMQSIVEQKFEPIFKTSLVLNIEENMRNSLIGSFSGSKTNQSRTTASTSKFEEDDEDDEDNEKKPDILVYSTIAPNQFEFKNFFRDLISKYEETAGKIQTLLHEPRFKLFYETPVYELNRSERQARLGLTSQSQDQQQHNQGFDNEDPSNMAHLPLVSPTMTVNEQQRPWPEVEFLFGEDESYQELVYSVMSLVTHSINTVTYQAESYNHFCRMIYSILRLDIDRSIRASGEPPNCFYSPVFTPDDFHYLLSKHTEQVYSMKSMVTRKRICIFDFYAVEFQETCLPFPNSVIGSIDRFMPQMAVHRNEKLQETMRDALKALDRDPSSVEDFVEHLAILSRINNELPQLEIEFSLVTRLFAIANEFNLSINPEQYAFFKSLGSTFQHLKSSLLYTEAQCEENIRKFTVDLGVLITRAHSECIDLKARLQSPVLLSIDTSIQQANETLLLFQEMIAKLAERAKNYASYQERFGNTIKQVSKKKTKIQEYIGTTDFSSRSSVSLSTLQSELNELEHDLALRKLLWQSINEWDQLVRAWLSKLLDEIKVDLIQKDVNRFTQNIYMLEKGLPANELVPRLKEKIMDFKKALPIIIALRNSNLKPRHFNQIKFLIGHDLVTDKEKITMSVLLNTDVLQKREKISEISALATNEATLESMLNRIIETWKKTDFRLVKDHSKDTFIITGTDEIQILLEESQITMSTIKSSRYVGPIKIQVEDWDRRLTLFSKTLDEWIVCQKRWCYLKQIFSTADIQRQLSQETKVFNQIEKFWKDLMRRTDDKPNALRAATAPGLFETLQSYAAQMEKIQRSLEDYFETKRLIFPRLYFLSNEDLLDILSQSKDPQKIQPHLNKCFANINSLEISDKQLEITHLLSFEGERLDIPKTIRIRGPAEQWLGSLESGMFDSIKRHLKIGLNEYATSPYKDWIVKQCGQIVLLVSQINFNKQVVKCMTSQHDGSNDSNALNALTSYRHSLVECINIASNTMSKELPNHKLLTIEALLTIQVHSRDILSDLIENKVITTDNYEWTRHLRYEWDDHLNQCTVMQSDSQFTYGFEYLGCSPRLVMTPLTDRCYLTLTGALKLNLGGAPAGPAGTGKTETVKDLAKAVAKLCLVFNCSEGLDYKMLGKFFSGLAQSGSWCCFDEFNRIDIEVLSVVAQQMLTIKSAKDQLAPRFVFEGHEIRLNNTCGFFITMNPTYAGRVELPDNLKPLFRPVAMMVADYALIAEIILFSVGFTSARVLATKIVTLYHLAARQLSHQDHYDFGMRTIKAVLLMAGQIKKKFTAQLVADLMEKSDAAEMSLHSINLSEQQESQILMQALNDTNLPKYLKDDVVLFRNLMNDLFPHVATLDKNQEIIERSINLATRELSYQSWPSQSEKIIQLYDQILVRHGIMLVGPSGGGKTVARSILNKALSIIPVFMAEKLNEKQKIPVLPSLRKYRYKILAYVKFKIMLDTKKGSLLSDEELHKLKNFYKRQIEKFKAKRARIESLTINPKSISIGELYGSTEPTTLEWSDGIFANTIRAYSSNMNASGAQGNAALGQSMNQALEASESEGNLPPWQFVVLDGPVDTFWVENLNTVLDDSKVLCLSNGERINLTPNVRVMFEVDSLIHTSPATVSRCAMVYFDPTDLGLTPIIKNWFNSFPKSFPQPAIDLINELLDFSLGKGFDFIEKRKGCTSFPFQRQNVLNFMFAMISSFIEFFEKNGGFGETDESKKEPVKRRNRQKESQDSSTLNPEAGGSTQKNYLLKNPKFLQPMIIKIYIFSYIWSFGGLLKREDNTEDDNIINQKSHVKTNFDSLTHEFDETVRELFEKNVKYGIYLPPNSKPVFDYFLDASSGNFVEWNMLVLNVESLIRNDSRSGASQDSSLIETIDSVRFTFFSTLLLMGRNPVLVTGSSGIGKTVIIESMLKKLSQTGFSMKSNSIINHVFNFSERSRAASVVVNVSSMFTGDDTNSDAMMGGAGSKKSKTDDINVLTNTIQFSAQTTSAKFLTMFASKLFKKGSNTLGAPKNKCILTFIDDLSIPIADRFGDQPPLELLRYIIENEGFFDLKSCSYKNILDVAFIACADLPNSSRSLISPRLLRQFCILSMPEPSARSLLNIYQVQLGRFMAENEFNVDIKSSLTALVSASIVVYYRAYINLLPTPAKAHYVFNLRDLAKLIKGMQQANSSLVVTREHLADLFAHEALRVFSDRLISRADLELFQTHLNETMVDYFKVPFFKKISPGQANTDDTKTEAVLYGDFMKSDDRVYQPLKNWKQLVSVLSDYQMRSNMSGNAANKHLVFFKEAVEHVCRACRVLRQPSAHMLLVGLDGTGKSTVLELATFISNCELFKLNIKKAYAYPDFRDDLKAVFKLTALQKKRIVFFIADKDITDEIFLEDLDSLLTSGNIPDLFDQDELNALFMEIKNDALIDGINDEKNELYKYLIKRVQTNLHLVLSMSPVGSKFRERCRFHPAIINCTTIDWYNDWSELAMRQVSMSFMESIDLKSVVPNLSSQEDQEIKEKISKACVYIHTSLTEAIRRYLAEHKRHVYVTPSCYIDLLRTFGKIFETKTNEYAASVTRLRSGLESLSEANRLVAEMKAALIVLGPQLEAKARETEELLVKLGRDRAAVNEVRSIVAAEEEKMRTETDLVGQYANEAEKDLADVKPLLAAARESLNALNKADISEVRVYNSPPFLVMTVMCAVCIILGKKPDWSSAKQVLGESGFITRLVNFNPEQVTEKTYIKFKQYSKNPDFKPDVIGKVSKACESLCCWVLAVEKFHEVYRTVRPKEERVREANEALKIMRDGLAKKTKILEQIQTHLDTFERKYSESLAEKQALEDRRELMKVRMSRATELTSALDIEKIRWTDQFKELERNSTSIIGVSILCAGAINYLGAMTQDYRASLLSDWLKYCTKELGLNMTQTGSTFDLTKSGVVASAHDIRTWISRQRLPDDVYSIENAIMLKHSLKWPLLVDPQGQATLWIREMEGAALRLCKSDDPTSVFRTLEQAVRLGEPVLVENVGDEQLDPLLDPILYKQIATRGAQKIIRLGDLEVEYNDNFRLYLVTSLANPHYLPSTFIKVNLINFTITFKCLFEQLLSQVVLRERPELETERVNLLESITSDSLLLRELEDKSLTCLSQSGSTSEDRTILDDAELIDVLKQTKQTSVAIERRLERNAHTEKSLNVARLKFAPIATRATVLYFTVQNLSELNVMYQFSLAWFHAVFQSCLGGGASTSSLGDGVEKKSTSGVSGGVVAAANGDDETDNEPIDDIVEPGFDWNLRKLASSGGGVANRRSSRLITPHNLDILPDEDFASHVNSIIVNLTRTVYQTVSWALFAQHQLIFSFSLCANILKNSGGSEPATPETISSRDYNFFLNSALLADMQLSQLNGRLKSYTSQLDLVRERLLLDEKVLRQLLLLEELIPEKFPSFLSNILSNFETLWVNFLSDKDPYMFMMNEENWKNFSFGKLSKFQRLIIIKLLRPDALILAIHHFIVHTLGPKFLASGVPTLAELYNQSQAHTPIVFILSPGSDPTQQLLRFAKETRGSTLHMDIVSLGQGQGPRAEELITRSLSLKGRWIFLQNCHLAASFMPRLQTIVNNFKRPGVEIDKQFRLFLSSKPDQCFPISLLKAGIKMTIESPRGLKNNLKQNFGSGGLVNKRIFESKDFGPHWRRLLFNLGFIHALIHERKKFGPLGWNLPYEFNNSDLEVAILQLQSVLSLNREEFVPFNVLKYITGEVIYGGRVTDDFDRRCLMSILGRFFSTQAVDEAYFYGDSQSYAAPKKELEYANLITYIDELPDEDDPSIFGMNIYAEKMLRAHQGEELIGCILAMEPRQAATSRIDELKNDTDVVLEMCAEISKSLPRQVSAEFAKGKHVRFEEALERLPQVMGEQAYYERAAALSTLMRQEIERYNRLLGVVHGSMHELTRALRGEIVISKTCENVFDSFLVHRVPDEWADNAYASVKPLAAWLLNLRLRVRFFSLWSTNLIFFVEGLAGVHFYPVSLWISAFFFPQGLLAAISQNYARKYKTSIDLLEFKYEIQNSQQSGEVNVDELFATLDGSVVRSRSELEPKRRESHREGDELKDEGVLLCGFFIDGGKWDSASSKLVDSPQRFSPLPHFICRMIKKNEENNSLDTNDKTSATNKYKCPVYRNSIRAGNPNDQSKNYVTSVDLDCEEDPEFWILRGLCMILQNND